MGVVLFNGALLVAALYIPVSLLYALLGLPYGGAVAASAIGPAALLYRRYRTAATFIDVRLANEVEDIADYSVCRRSQPAYRFVDLHRAVAELQEASAGSVLISSHHDASLVDIVAREFDNDDMRKMRTPGRFARPVSHDQEKFFADDAFVLLKGPPAIGAEAPEIVRLRKMEYGNEIVVEVAAIDPDIGEQLMERILKLAAERSIYRNRTLEVAFGGEVRQTPWGEVEHSDDVDVIIKPPEAVTDDDLVLDDEARAIMERNVIDLHQRRDALVALGVPGKRGVLFYGPPGTGKTYTCKYIAHRLKDATVVVAAGHALHRAKSVFNVARMLRPAIVVLEDVDLVFSSRDQNIHGSSVGELLDELDGFAKDDAIIFILTTNAIERVEAAIKDRPGRISQCIHFGLPGPRLRERYMRNFFEAYDVSTLDVDRLVAVTDRASQAFLKEFVFRAVQVASESHDGDAASLALTTDHFDRALDEIKQSGGSGAIVGFHSAGDPSTRP